MRSFCPMIFLALMGTLFAADDPVVVLAQKKEWAAVLAAVEKEPSLISKADEKNGTTVLLLAILNKDSAWSKACCSARN